MAVQSPLRPDRAAWGTLHPARMRYVQQPVCAAHLGRSWCRPRLPPLQEVLDGDLILLHGQERRLAQVRRVGVVGAGGWVGGWVLGGGGGVCRRCSARPLAAMRLCPSPSRRAEAVCGDA
jgi:hypothetical protein